MADIIRLLPDHVANQIAAGEVVQRPASVVKELLENAIDAKATTIQLIIKDAGKALIQVIDNGIGMSQTDARMSFERHATSKIQAAEDLFNLKTKGFRGEALASIAAIAQVELKTKKEAQELGTILKVEGSKIIENELISTPKGTSIAVKNLFFNIPARRNFLKSNAVETRHIVDEFQRVALAHPKISFSLKHNTNEIYQLKGSNLKKRIIAIFGDRINDKLVPINEDTDLVKIQGFITNPQFAKKKRGEQFFFANQRFIKSNYLNHAVSAAYDGLIDAKYFPSFFIFMEVNPKQMDINIHPTKTEIKFENESAIYAIIRSSIKHSLGQYSVAPVLDFNRDKSFDTPYKFSNKAVKKAPNVAVDSNFNPFKDDIHATDLGKKSEYHNQFIIPEFSTENVEVTIESELSQGKMFDNTTDFNSYKTFQVQDKYIITTLKNSLIVIHQHLAHFRILYEDLLTKITVNEIPSQKLLIPIEIDFAKADIGLLYENKSDLETIGFEFLEFKSDGVVLNGIPSFIKQEEIVKILESVLDDIQLEVPNESLNKLDGFIKQMAKKMAVKVGKTLTNKEQENIMDSLFSCKEFNYAPNGKKTFVTMEINEIDTKFN